MTTPTTQRAALIATLVLAVALRADEPPKPGRTLDALKLPPGTIILISDNPRDAVPEVGTVVLSADEYRKLRDAAEQLQKLAAADRPEAVSACRLSGKVEVRGIQEVVSLRARFLFRTTAPRATVPVGLQKARPTAATLDDGQLAVLLPGEDGFAVQVEAPGEHKLTVDAEVPLAARGPKGAERGFDVGLPGAAITLLERFELPEGVTRLRLGTRTVAARLLAAESAAAVALGPVKSLDAAWDVPGPATRPASRTAVEGKTEVRVDEKEVFTHARLTIKAVQTPTDGWKLAVPRGVAKVTVEGPAGAEGTAKVEEPRDPRPTVWTVRRESGSDDVTVDVQVRTSVPAKRPVPVILPTVAGTDQRGTLTVAGPPNLKLGFTPRGDLTRRDNPDESSRDAFFTYASLPGTGQVLDVDPQPVPGELEVQVAHQLTLGERGWRLSTRIDCKPVRLDVDRLDLVIPNDLQDVRAGPSELVEAVVQQPGDAAGAWLLQLRLTDPRRRPFTVTLEGLYPLAAGAAAATLPLPRVPKAVDRGGSVSASVPAGLELRGGLHEWEGDRPGEWERPLENGTRSGALAATAERAPARLDLSWRSPRADAPLAATVDVHLGERQAAVRQHLRGPAGPKPLTLRGPALLAGRVRLLDGGTLTAGAPGEWAVTPAAGKELALTLAYNFPLEKAQGLQPPGLLTVPLLWPDPAARCETAVRVWSGFTPGGVLAPALADGPWTEEAPPAVPDESALPALALRGAGGSLPLVLRLTETAGGPATGLVAERVWVQALADEEGAVAYRTRFLLRPQHVSFLTVELPAPAVALNLTALLDDKKVGWEAVDETGAVARPAGRLIRFRIEPTGGPTVLELDYQRSPGAAADRWQTELVPPRVVGPVFVGPVRWQIGLAHGGVPFDLAGSASFEQRLTWQRGLFAPQPARTTAALQRWFYAGGHPPGPEPDVGATLVGRHGLEPLRLLVVPRPLALLAGSLVVLALGLLATALGRAWGATVTLVALAAGLLAAVARPQAMAEALAVCQPGLVVLFAVLVVQGYLQRRYRRRVVFMPGFTRQPAPGSSLVRNGNGSRSRREPSTIDAPP